MVNEKMCIFCETKEISIAEENRLAYVINDKYPVTHGHSLIIPFRHTSDYSDLTDEEIIACNQLLQDRQDFLKTQDSTIAGFNIGVNQGEVAGQTVFHCHVHLIPRRHGDSKKIEGGIRNLLNH